MVHSAGLKNNIFFAVPRRFGQEMVMEILKRQMNASTTLHRTPKQIVLDLNKPKVHITS